MARKEHSNEGSMASQPLESELSPRRKGILNGAWGGQEEREAKWPALPRGWERPGGHRGQ